MSQNRGALPARAPLARPRAGKVIAGVAEGLASHLGYRPWTVRFVFIVLSICYGIGVMVYGALWVLLPAVTNEPREAAGLEAARRRGMRPVETDAVRTESGLLVPVGILTLGVLWLFVSGGFIPARLFWPVVIAGAGVVVMWLQADDRRGETYHGLWQQLTRGGGVMSILRLVGGLVLVASGASWIVATQVGLQEVPMVLAASGLLLAGLVVVAAPWLFRQRAQLRKADADRVRAQARADMAAHLHDSVLQTLALIQRQANDPATVATLARRQERELRTWLYGETTRAAALRSALREVVAEVEARFTVEVELVCVGDIAVDDRIEALVLATGEALTNAAKHSGAPRIDVYAEVEDHRVEVFVRDRGVGFTLENVSEDRMGVRESIVARMQRYGGSATIRSATGEGTEIRLVMG